VPGVSAGVRADVRADVDNTPAGRCVRVGSAGPKRPWLTAHAGVSPGHTVRAVREGRFRSAKATLAHRPRGGAGPDQR